MALSTRLFVGNLPDNLDEKSLRDLFSSYGEVTNFDLKSKPGIESDKKVFAFVTISGSNFNIESCIKHFANETFQGTRLHVTRARESFLERLQREREQSKKNDNKQVEQPQQKLFSESLPINRKNNKRKFVDDEQFHDDTYVKEHKIKYHEKDNISSMNINYKDYNKKELSNSDYGNKNKPVNGAFQNDEKKQNSDKKRLESMKKKRQEFNEKKNIIKFGLTAVDKKANKKVVFSDNEEDSTQNITIQNGDGKKQESNKKSTLFDDEGSDDEINFEIKKQFEGKKGQKVLDLQSRYKSDKRFVLDERFVDEDSGSDKEDNDNKKHTEDQSRGDQDEIEIGQADEKSKQLGILQDVLGITIKPKPTEPINKTKAKLGMLRFDPSQPEHAKFLAPIETNQEVTKKTKKKKSKDKEQTEEISQPEPVVEKVEVSKEQFYKVSDTLKEAIAQPTSFSLRSLFAKDKVREETSEQDNNYIPIKSKKEIKVKNPFEPSEKNPFVYDSSESENEEDTNDNTQQVTEEKSEPKIVWREKLFFTPNDNRLKEGLLFFTKSSNNSVPKERRELKSLMKKRIYNKERKNTMFQKKIGGRKKTMKKKFKKG